MHTFRMDSNCCTSPRIRSPCSRIALPFGMQAASEKPVGMSQPDEGLSRDESEEDTTTDADGSPHPISALHLDVQNARVATRRCPSFFRTFAEQDASEAFSTKYDGDGIVWVVTDGKLFPALELTEEQARNAAFSNEQVKAWLRKQADEAAAEQIAVQYVLASAAAAPISVVHCNTTRPWSAPFPGSLGGLQAVEDAVLRILHSLRPNPAVASESLMRSSIQRWWERHGVIGIDVASLAAGPNPRRAARKLWARRDSAAPAAAEATAAASSSSAESSSSASCASSPPSAVAVPVSAERRAVTAAIAATWRTSALPRPRIKARAERQEALVAMMEAGGILSPTAAAAGRRMPAEAAVARNRSPRVLMQRWTHARGWCCGLYPEAEMAAELREMDANGSSAIATSSAVACKLAHVTGNYQHSCELAQAMYAVWWRREFVKEMNELEKASLLDHSAANARSKAWELRQNAEMAVAAANSGFVSEAEAAAIAAQGDDTVRAGDLVQLDDRNKTVAVVVRIFMAPAAAGAVREAEEAASSARMLLATGMAVRSETRLRRGRRAAQRQSSRRSGGEPLDAQVRAVGASDAVGGVDVFAPREYVTASEAELRRLFEPELRVFRTLGQLQPVRSQIPGYEGMTRLAVMTQSVATVAEEAEEARVAELGSAGRSSTTAAFAGEVRAHSGAATAAYERARQRALTAAAAQQTGGARSRVKRTRERAVAECRGSETVTTAADCDNKEEAAAPAKKRLPMQRSAPIPKRRTMPRRASRRP